MEEKDFALGKGTITVEKCREGEDAPYETVTGENIWLTTGWTELLNLAIGSSSNHFITANTTVGVGDTGSGAGHSAAASDTDLWATSNKLYKTLLAGFPTTPSSGVTTLRVQFLTSEANWAWNEMVVKQSVSGVCWNRSTTGWGTKTSSEIWTVTITLGKA